jgi:hypothetical protein
MFNSIIVIIISLCPFSTKDNFIKLIQMVLVLWVMMMMIRLIKKLFIQKKLHNFLLFVSPLLLEQLAVVDDDDRLRRFNFLIKTSRTKKIFNLVFQKKKYFLYILLTRRDSRKSCSSFCRLSCSFVNSFRRSTKNKS